MLSFEYWALFCYNTYCTSVFWLLAPGARRALAARPIFAGKVIIMQMTFEQAFRPGWLSAFALKRNRGYMMRSEKRPAYGSGGGDNRHRKPPRRKRAGLPYILLTLLISVILWPIGMIMLWRRKVRMQAGTKLLLSLLTLCICVFLIVFALNINVKNERLRSLQNDANDFLKRTEVKLGETFDDVYKRSGEAWGDITDFSEAAVGYGLPKAADALDTAVDYAGRARVSITGLLGGSGKCHDSATHEQ